jgi:peptide/nickel transport system substrate-binding protein
VFHNGDGLDADDVVYTLNWVAKPSSGVLHQQNVSWIDRVEKLGPYKVRLISKKPFPAALELLSGPMPIYSRRYLESAGAPAGPSTKAQCALPSEGGRLGFAKRCAFDSRTYT